MKRLDTVIDAAIAGRRIVGGQILVARDGEVAYFHAAGHADRESGARMRRDTILRYASLSKPVVTVAALALVEQDVVEIDAPITRYLPAFRPRMEDGTEPVITLRHLLTHTTD